MFSFRLGNVFLKRMVFCRFFFLKSVSTKVCVLLKVFQKVLLRASNLTAVSHARYAFLLYWSWSFCRQLHFSTCDNPETWLSQPCLHSTVVQPSERVVLMQSTKTTTRLKDGSGALMLCRDWVWCCRAQRHNAGPRALGTMATLDALAGELQETKRGIGLVHGLRRQTEQRDRSNEEHHSPWNEAADGEDHQVREGMWSLVGVSFV